NGLGHVSPNPLVGAVMVHNDQIIGEGYHKKFGEAHAEVNCIESVSEANWHLIEESTLFVSLEPCAHFGKTPPCADLIIRHKIPKVIIGCRDPFKDVDGKGIEKLMAAGVEVERGLLEDECKDLNKRFFVFHVKHRPYIILKWAQTADGIIAAPSKPPPTWEAYEDSDDSRSVNSRLLISNEYSNRLVHKWRSEEAAILVGTNTALLDNPSLTTRLWTGPSPIRLVLDMKLHLPSSLKIFNQEVRTIIFNSIKQEEDGSLKYYLLNKDDKVIHQMMQALYQLNIQSVLVEGGARLLQSFIDDGLWDEARIITGSATNNLAQRKGLHAPLLFNADKIDITNLDNDRIEIFTSAYD
ncbi:MAG: bifunctional diaminohydroxyphosphoribosylaminopyrimidine deaminase/5-amino-6-(5-phosphoribosylamino)uracil reductase RibD, partial [Chitinophagaceae bacterium]